MEQMKRKEEIRRQMMENRERAREMNQRRINFPNNNFPFFFQNQENNYLSRFILNNIFNLNNDNNNFNDNRNINYNNNYENNDNINDNNYNFNNNNIIINDNDNNEKKDDDNNFGDMLEEIKLTQDIINKAEAKECSICLEEYTVENKISYLPCFHFFHSLCIKNWTKKSKKCPLCNIEIKFE